MWPVMAGAVKAEAAAARASNTIERCIWSGFEGLGSDLQKSSGPMTQFIRRKKEKKEKKEKNNF